MSLCGLNSGTRNNSIFLTFVTNCVDIHSCRGDTSKLSSYFEIRNTEDLESEIIARGSDLSLCRHKHALLSLLTREDRREDTQNGNDDRNTHEDIDPCGNRYRLLGRRILLRAIVDPCCSEANNTRNAENNKNQGKDAECRTISLHGYDTKHIH